MGDHQGRVRRVWPGHCPQEVLLNPRFWKKLPRIPTPTRPLQLLICPSDCALWGPLNFLGCLWDVFSLVLTEAAVLACDRRPSTALAFVARRCRQLHGVIFMILS